MNLPRRLTSVMRESLSFRLNAEADVGQISFGSVTSVATMRWTTTTRRNARTTCSTSGSSGMRRSLSQSSSGGKPTFLTLSCLCLNCSNRTRSSQRPQEQVPLKTSQVRKGGLPPQFRLDLVRLRANDRFNLRLDVLNQPWLVSFEVQTQQRFRI